MSSFTLNVNGLNASIKKQRTMRKVFIFIFNKCVVERNSVKQTNNRQLKNKGMAKAMTRKYTQKQGERCPCPHRDKPTQGTAPGGDVSVNSDVSNGKKKVCKMKATGKAGQNRLNGSLQDALLRITQFWVTRNK